ncbi:aminodeoxychorismate/anthranilate synthase component II [Staphylococcus hyicus]|uniref:Aminodeoxychorismate/anthranilate synthase component II n=1 Tax=Staphylococcus hyicus TaxID=1284 RepID=A0A0A8HRR8_STAHY|nr:aminodeoxychorismate/anthranilate synthase component II [Staphylococcus hyicus]AJC96761.1 para-aminobenzoate synthase subunit II [Staphylococcus hyicus]MCE5153533.1 aminodeoxychorismate/anthranilate synthase component II [Staphylococcus hyicus]MCQ9290094.1 aminodeoxychorismate/anthranilate synthase component II [Staphylococcus hyicus]MCQ9301802.1 aminodeoxychorismate/anthranilate synthase component II [Staphylococcus hyicus]MCQ9305335.1 aminodeoxychorismate/anthranilate synthase component I
MIVMIDNKDSFTYNVVDLIYQATSHHVTVIDIHEATIDKIQQLQPQAIVISPGPGTPEDYPILFEVLKHFEYQCPILGVCLGFQLIAAFYGGHIVKAPWPVHGHTTKIYHDQSALYEGLPSPFQVMRYHSLMVDITSLRAPLKVTAKNEDGIVLGIKHESRPIYGVQYHPESIMSEHGCAQMNNFFNEVGLKHGCHI